MPYYGVDNDADKIGRATAAAGRTGLAPARFEVVDLAHHLPRHEGSVAILDVLQYLRAPAQRQLLEDVIAMLTPGARLRSEEQTSELQSLMRISYAVF